MPVVVGPVTTAPVSGNDLLNTTRNRYLLSGLTEQRNKLLAPYTAGGTTLQFKYDLGGIARGARLCIGMNTFYVWDVNPSAKTAEVEPGYNGALVEDASFDAVVDVNPRYFNFDIFQALNEEITALPSLGLYQMRQVEFPYVASRVGYDLTATDLIAIHEVRYAEPNGFRSTPRLDPSMYRLERNDAESGTGLSLKLFGSGFPGQNVTVLYKSRFQPFTTLADAMSVTGLPDSMRDIPPMGAALRLMLSREVRRNQTQSQGDTRRAEEVGPGAVAASTRNLQQAYRERIADEIGKLAQAYPPRV